jgi:hypothetical protein
VLVMIRGLEIEALIADWKFGNWGLGIIRELQIDWGYSIMRPSGAQTGTRR